MTQPDILVPIILSGSTGSRLWPVSRESHPKPFITLPDKTSLLQKTFLRAAHFSQAVEIITLTNKEYYLKTKAEYEKISVDHPIPTLSYLLEPAARNTAPAIALAAWKVFQTYGPHAVLLILPADHLIENLSAFKHSCLQAAALAKTNKLVTFGIKPTIPETGFGYIECGNNIAAHEHCYDVLRFIEKPHAELAQTFLQAKNYLWNAGMFCFTAETILHAFTQHAPQLLNAVKQCWQVSQNKNSNAAVFEFDEALFTQLQDISIDYAIMEKSQNIAVIAGDFDWQDVGSWEAYKKLHQADQHGNTIVGEAILIDSQNNFIHSESRMVASIGIQNLAVIDTPDALLITHRDRTQDVRQVVRTLKNNAHESYLTHRTVIRPWGSYTVLEEGPSFKIKRIVVKPGASLSLQLHHHRSEHWVVVEGMAKVCHGDKEYLLKINESTFIPMNTPHRLSNPDISDLVIIEVQTGNYLGEDDIVRIEDNYGRTT